MANVQTAADPSSPNAADTIQSQPLTPITLLLRFLYTGTTSSSIPVKCKPELENIDNTLSCIITLAQARALLPLSTIRKVSIRFEFK